MHISEGGNMVRSRSLPVYGIPIHEVKPYGNSRNRQVISLTSCSCRNKSDLQHTFPVLLDLPSPAIDIFASLQASQCLHFRLGDVLQCPASDHSRLNVDIFLCPRDHFAAHILFDRQDNSHIPLADKGNASAFSARSRGTSDPMHVICRISRDIVIDDKIDVWDVETS